jgi:hypothetical protein
MKLLKTKLFQPPVFADPYKVALKERTKSPLSGGWGVKRLNRGALDGYLENKTGETFFLSTTL